MSSPGVKLVRIDARTGRWNAAAIGGRWFYGAEASAIQQQFRAAGGDEARVPKLSICSEAIRNARGQPIARNIGPQPIGETLTFRPVDVGGERLVEGVRSRAGKDPETELHRTRQSPPV